MDRRRCLKRVAVCCLPVAVAGCTEATLEEAEQPAGVLEELFDAAEIELPVEQRIDVLVDRIERLEGESLEDPAAFESSLTEAGLDVDSLEERDVAGETVLELAYVIENPAAEGNVHSLGIVAGAYAALVRGGYDGDSLESSLHDAEGREFGTYDVETVWAEAHDASERSVRSYAGEVLHTLESG